MLKKYFIPQSSKPILRGHVHQEAFFVSLGACSMLILKSSTNKSILSTCVFSLGLLFLFGTSAIYHRPNWNKGARSFLRKLDHCAIFVLIASTSTPFCLLALPPESGKSFLILIWGIAIFGLIQSFFWIKAPKVLVASFYILMGWMAIPYLGELEKTLGFFQVFLLVLGGLLYTIGAICYALKKPILNPHLFGYHEVFHVLTVLAAILHFIIIYQMV